MQVVEFQKPEKTAKYVPESEPEITWKDIRGLTWMFEEDW